MRRKPGLFLLLLLLIPLAQAPAAAEGGPGVTLSRRESERLGAGEVVVRLAPTASSTMKDVVCVGYVEAPADEVWRVITDYHDYPRIFPAILKSETRKKTGLVEQHYTLLDYPWPLPDKWTINEITHHPSRRAITWKRIDGTLKELVGSWRLYPEGGRTLVVYTVRVDPGLPLVPAWAVQWGTTRVAPDIIRNIRKHVR